MIFINLSNNKKYAVISNVQFTNVNTENSLTPNNLFAYLKNALDGTQDLQETNQPGMSPSDLLNYFDIHFIEETKQIVIIAYASWLVLLSIITFIAYGADKKKAKDHKYRTKEKTLLGLSFFGGAFGGYPAMLIFRHKTKAEHWYFTAVNLLGLAIHITLMILIIFVFKF